LEQVDANGIEEVGGGGAEYAVDTGLFAHRSQLPGADPAGAIRRVISTFV